MLSIIEPIQEPTYFLRLGSKPSDRTLDIFSPIISPLPSATTQKPPSDRTDSVPVDFTGASPGAMEHSPSTVHSPTSCWSHSCSFTGEGILNSSFPAAAGLGAPCLGLS